jgi:hypothetical protein
LVVLEVVAMVLLHQALLVVMELLTLVVVLAAVQTQAQEDQADQVL